MQRHEKITTTNGVDHLLSKSSLKNDKINLGKGMTKDRGLLNSFEDRCKKNQPV